MGITAVTNHGCQTRKPEKRKKICYLCHDLAREKNLVLMKNLVRTGQAGCISIIQNKNSFLFLNLKALEDRLFFQKSLIVPALGSRPAGFNVKPFV